MLLQPQFLLGVECASCVYPSGANYVITTNRQELETVLPSAWQNDIFYRTLYYIANGLHIALYNNINVILTNPDVVRPIVFLMNTDHFPITDFNTTLSNLFNLDIFLFANINSLTYADVNLYVPFDTLLRKYAVLVYGNMFVPHTGQIVWNVGDYLLALARNHEEMRYFCPINERVRGSLVGGYSAHVLNQLRDNKINVPFRNRLLGPSTLDNDVFAVVYGHVIIKRFVRTLLRRYLLRDNNEDLWIEVEHDLSNALRMIQDAPCGPVIINVLVNDPRINTPNSNILNVEIQYSNAGTLGQFSMGPHAHPGGLTVPPIPGFIQTINISIPLASF